MANVIYFGQKNLVIFSFCKFALLLVATKKASKQKLTTLYSKLSIIKRFENGKSKTNIVRKIRAILTKPSNIISTTVLLSKQCAKNKNEFCFSYGYNIGMHNYLLIENIRNEALNIFLFISKKESIKRMAQRF